MISEKEKFFDPRKPFQSARPETHEEWQARMGGEVLAVVRSGLYLDFRFLDQALSALTPTADYEAETQKKRTAGLLDKPTLEARLQTAKTLRSWEKELLRAAAPDADAAFKVLRTQFGTLSDARDTAQQTASAALEAAFDFMEQAFAESQEMVVFVTELTLSPAAHAFIAENGCERYFQYNKDLLLDHRKAALNQELEAEQRRHGML